MGFLNPSILATTIGFLLATPVLTAPSGDSIVVGFPSVENIVPQEYIDQVHAYYEAKARTESQRYKRALNALQKRVPSDILCDRDDEWIQRTCVSDDNPREYQDDCQREDGEEYERDGECPPDTVCQPDETVTIVDGEEIETFDIICQPATPPRPDIVSTKNRQYGYREVASSSGSQDVAIPILADYGSASVSAEILSQDRSYIIFPSGTLTGNYRGHQLNLCKQNRNDAHYNSRQCIPTGSSKKLSKGGTIDFTFALSAGQRGFLFYSIA